jgi:hypothetical protein
MNRAEGAMRYAGLVEQNEKLIARLVAAAASRPRSFEACAALSFAEKAASLTDSYAMLLSVLRPEGGFRSPSYGGAAAIKARLREEARGIVVKTRVTGNAGGAAQRAFTQALTSRGYRTGEKGGYTLLADCRIEDSPQTGSDFVYVSLMLQAELKDSSGERLFAWQETERQGHRLREQARERGLRKAEEIITETGFAPAFDAWLLSLL